MASKIYKHIFQVIVLSEDQNILPTMDLANVLQSISNGDDIGQESHVSTTEVPAEQVHDELIAIGNDGTFFGEEDTSTDYTGIHPVAAAEHLYGDESQRVS